MEKQRIVCGIDVHKEFLQICLLTDSGEISYHRFRHTFNGILELKDLLTENECTFVAFESTGIYWYRLYLMLEENARVIVANPYQIKNIPGKKTDIKDSHWIAQLALNNLIKPSRIFPREDREFRDLTRNREILVKQRSTIKNRIHKILDSSGYSLKPVLKDLFGKSGRHIIQGIVDGRDQNEIIETIPSSVIKRRSDDIREALMGNFSDVQLILLKRQLELLKSLDEQISKLDELIIQFLSDEKLDDLKICMSVPGIGEIAGLTILAEISNYRDFQSPGQLASWAGLTPSVYQSADKLITGRITKRGSRHLRWILTEVAQSASRTKNTKWNKFFKRISYKHGNKKAVIALARKILCVLWHLLMNRELYEEDNKPLKQIREFKPKSSLKLSIEDAIDFIVKEGYKVFVPDSGQPAFKGKPRGS